MLNTHRSRSDAEGLLRGRRRQLEVGQQLGPLVPERRGVLGLQRDVARDRAAQLRRSQRLEALELARHARRDDLEGLAGLVDVLARALDGALGGDGAALGAGPAASLAAACLRWDRSAS